MKIINIRLYAVLLISMLFTGLFAGCGNSNISSDSTFSSQSYEEESVDDTIISDIKERGYIKVGCKTDVPGLGFYDPVTDTWSGIEVELAYQTAANIFETDIISAKENRLVEFIGVTVADREEHLEKGDIDIMFATYTITEERKGKFALSDSYYTDYIGIMVRKEGVGDLETFDGGAITSIAGLDGKYVGIPKNATTRKDALNYISTMSVTPTPIFNEYESYDVIFRNLKDRNIDAMMVDVSILNGYVDNSTMILGDRFAGQHYGAAVTKAHKALIPYINKAIEQ